MKVTISKTMACIALICVTCVLYSAMFFVADSLAWGEGSAGGGGNASTDVHPCDNPKKYTYDTTVCDKNEKGYNRGGVAWVIFKTTSSTHNGGIYSGISYKKSLVGTDYDSMKQICPKSEYDYVVVLTYLGWKSNSTNDAYWGPIASAAKNNGHKLHPNNNAAKDADEIEALRKKGKDLSHIRVSTSDDKRHGQVLKLYNKWRKANGKSKRDDIPASTGFFCASFDADLIAYARTENGTMLNGGKQIDKKTASTGEKASVSNKTDVRNENGIEYRFKGWSLKTSGGADSKLTDSTYTTTMKSDNINVYAVYTAVDGDCIGDCCPDDAGYPNCPTTTTDDLCEQWGSVVPGKTTTTSRVRNASVADYADWSGSVYAKPTDKIYWHHCYYPGVQTMAFELATPSGSHVNNSGHAEAPSDCSKWSSSCSSLSSYEFTNMMLSSGAFGTWTNKFNIGSGSDKGSYSSTYNGQSKSFPTGDSTAQSFNEPNNSNVRFSDVGATLNEKITTGSPISASVSNQGPYSWSCTWAYDDDEVYATYGPYCDKTEDVTDDKGNVTGTTCVESHYEYDIRPTYAWSSTCEHKTDFISSTIDKNTTSTKADVLVPYNFENETVVTNDDGEVVFAGETYTVNFDINVNPRVNDILSNDGIPYATKVKGGKSRIKVCPDGMECSYSSNTNETSLENFTSTSDFENGYGINRSTSIVIPDLPAGRNVCVQSQMYPVDSHDDLNMSESIYPESDESSWAQSEFVCFVVAKKPTLQAWGGNVFSQNDLNTSIAVKRHLGGESYSPSSGGTSGTHLFGSWGELGVFSNGTVTGFASGASLGYGSGSSPAFENWGWSPAVNPTGVVGGSTTSLNSICNRNRLTFSNADAFSKQCMLNSIGGMRSLSNISKIENDKSSIINILAANSNVEQVLSKDIYTDGETSDEPYVVRIYKAENSITINGDIRYTGLYDSLEKIPKIILYANDVDISCNVKQVDALIIAEGVVDTCYESDDPNDPERSNQLRVNGAIIASRLDAKRTYGAGPGVNSGIAAEIIDFDPALYSFGGGLTDTETDNVAGRLDVSSIHELAPRK